MNKKDIRHQAQLFIVSHESFQHLTYFLNGQKSNLSLRYQTKIVVISSMSLSIYFNYMYCS